MPTCPHGPCRLCDRRNAGGRSRGRRHLAGYGVRTYERDDDFASPAQRRRTVRARQSAELRAMVAAP